MVDDGDTPGITSADYVALRSREGLVDSHGFYYWLRLPYGERSIASLVRWGVRERMLLNRLAKGEISLPPLHVQQAASQTLAEPPPRPKSNNSSARLSACPNACWPRYFRNEDGSPEEDRKNQETQGHCLLPIPILLRQIDLRHHAPLQLRKRAAVRAGAHVILFLCILDAQETQAQEEAEAMGQPFAPAL